jgi:glycosyltransferase involved in cell wall biosynthesis
MQQVIHLIDDLRVGGAQRLLLTFATEAMKRGVRTGVISLTEDLHVSIASQLRIAGVEVMSCPSESKRELLDVPRLLRLIRLIRQSSAAVIHTHLTYSNILGTIAGRIAGKPVVNSFHGLPSTARGSSVMNLVEYRVLDLFSNGIVAVGDVVTQRHQPFLRRQTILTVPSAVHPVAAITEEQRRKHRVELIGDDQRILILSLGRLTEEKGYLDLMRAFKIILGRVPSCALVIIGDDRGPHAELIKDELLRLDLKGHVYLLRPRDQVHELLGAADIYICSSHSEGLPLSLLEAMSAGLPVIATRVGAIPDVIDESNGLLVPSQDVHALAGALETFIHSPNRRRLLADGAQKTIATSFDVGIWFNRLMAIYDDIEDARSGSFTSI